MGPCSVLSLHFTCLCLSVDHNRVFVSFSVFNYDYYHTIIFVLLFLLVSFLALSLRNFLLSMKIIFYDISVIIQNLGYAVYVLKQVQCLYLAIKANGVFSVAWLQIDYLGIFFFMHWCVNNNLYDRINRKLARYIAKLFCVLLWRIVLLHSNFLMEFRKLCMRTSALDSVQYSFH